MILHDEGVGEVETGIKYAIIVSGPLMVAVDEAAPLLLNDVELVLLNHPENAYPELAVAEIGNAPLSFQLLLTAGETVPAFGGTAVIEVRYCVFQFAVSVIGLFICNEFAVFWLLIDPAPVPVQLVKMYCVPAVLLEGLVTLKVAVAPASYQP